MATVSIVRLNDDKNVSSKLHCPAKRTVEMTAGYPAERFRISDPQNIRNDVSELHNICGSTDFKF